MAQSKTALDKAKPWIKFGAGLIFNCNPVSTPPLIDMYIDTATKGEEEYNYSRENAERKNDLHTGESFINGKVKPETPKWSSTKKIVTTTLLAGASAWAYSQSFTAGCLCGLTVVAAKAIDDSDALGFMNKEKTSIMPNGERIPHKTKKFSSGALVASIAQSAVGSALTGAGNLLHEPVFNTVREALDKYIY
jgi:hypothetical protein